MAVHTAAASWPLVGREQELAFVREALGSRRAAGLVLAGAAGVGKTRLALEALREAEAAGYATAWAVATRAAASIPFGALASLLPPVGGGTGLLQILRRAGDALAERAGGRPVLLAVDDAHLLDGASATLLLQLAATGAAFTVATVRSGERPADPIVALWKDGRCDYLEVEPLSREELGRLVAAVLGGDVDGGTLQALWSATQGNPLFLRELVLDGLKRGVLGERDGLWRWHGPLAAGSRLLELIDARLGELDAIESDVLELLAFGEPLGASLLEAVAAPEAAEAVQRRGLLEVGGDGHRVEVRLAHPLYAEALRARTPLLRARAIQRRLADALEATGAHRRADLLRLASWRLASGGGASPELLVAGARQAQAGLDAVLSERLARAALNAGGGFAARHALARAVARQGRFDEAEALFERLEGEAPADAERRVVAEARARNLLWGLGRGSDAEEVLAGAERTVTECGVRDELAAVRGWVLCFLGRPAEALAAVSPVLEAEGARESLSVRAAMATANAMAMAGRPSAAADLAGQWRSAALRLADKRPLLAAQLESVRLLGLYLSGRLEEAAAVVAQDYDAALASGMQEGTAIFASARGAISMGRGEIRAAVRWLREGAALMREFDPVGFLPWTLAYLAQAAGQAGDASGAQATVAEAEAVLRPGARMFDVDLGLARAWAAAAGGELSLARAEALQAADRGEAQGHYGFALLALHDLARLGDAATAAPRLAALARRVDGRLAPPCAGHAAALASRDAPALDDAAAALEATGALLRAAEAAGAAASAYRATGRAASARAASARAALLAQHCKGARTPGLVTASPLDELTEREREIATLATAGLANPEIAARLVLSVRTVENHLQHAYRKLGVTSRRELGQLLGSSRSADGLLRR
jgi:DNA-binding NarL/FixJ family response regulator